MKYKIGICGFEIITIILSIIAFTYMIGELPSVSANAFVPTGCCAKDNKGAICQQMLMSDSELCKEQLIATSCEEVAQCQKGCCYNAKQGTCSLNSPKQTCSDNGGNWSDSSTCNIAECQLGCCILGDEASVTTTRECSLLSKEYKIEKQFKELDSIGGCDSYTNLEKKGACLTPSEDFSGLNSCAFTKKSLCSGEFHEEFLCTAKELNTECEKTKDTTCIEGRDEVYFVDDCGNQANIYDAQRYEDETYWTNVIEPKDSCSTAGKDCGNCNYVSGSRCYEKRAGRDENPTYGNFVCRNLNCENGRKHGESWCIYDLLNLGKGEDPVGARYYKGICLEGELSIEGCADFNQEICLESTDTSFGFTEAQCVVNGWRSCIQANGKETYSEVERECAKYEQCMMYTEIEGMDKAMGMPGFKEKTNNKDQGSARKIGENANPVIAYCLPKYSPGLQFWSDETLGVKDEKQEKSIMGTGGSIGETTQICSMGDFTCVKTKQKDSLTSGFRDDKNIQCFDENEAPVMLESLNERCKRLGPCGAKVNIAGVKGYSDGYRIQATEIDPDGDIEEIDYKFAPSESYLGSLLGKVGLIVIGSMKKLEETGLSSGLSNLNLATGSDNLNVAGGGDHSLVVEESEGKQSSLAAEAASRGQIATYGLQAMQLIGGLGSAKDTVAIAATGASGSASSAATSGQIANSPANEILTKAASSELNSGLFAQDVSSAYGIPTEASSITATETPTTGIAQGTTGAQQTGTSSTASVATSGLIAVAAIAAYYVMLSVGKQNGWTPGQTQAWASIAAGATSLILTSVLWAFTGLISTGIGSIAAVVLAIAMIIYSYFSYKDEYKFYIMTFSCEPWEAPTGGECELCNKDIRTCSEYRCRSLGANCKYFNDNGEPGYCAAIDDTWSAKITPWQEILTKGYKYNSVSLNGFKIEQEKEIELKAWENLDFGVQTDKYATCKLDDVHTQSYEDMKFEMITANGYDHQITISPHILKNSTSSSTPGMAEGDNQYYIRCKNFAGETNRAEFAVKFILGEGYDLTPPKITMVDPETPAYAGFGKNSTEVTLYVNEPAECRYSQEIEENYANMKGNMSCITDPDINFRGNWMCHSYLNDLKKGENKFFFKCRDQPATSERASLQRNTNEIPEEYSVSLCSEGLEITSISPEKAVVSGKTPLELELKLTTKGCVNSGEADCYYHFGNGQYAKFFETGATSHKQEFNMLFEGNYNVSLKCEDKAGNLDIKSTNIEVKVDNVEPKIIRTYDFGNSLVIITNEQAKCWYSQDTKTQCDFELGTNSSAMSSDSQGVKHNAPWINNKVYYVKCMDNYGNKNANCGVTVKTY